jgi:hypothetical protein
MEMNKKELKKIMYAFSTISSRMMRASYEDYNMVLEKFLRFIDENEIIIDYINSGYRSDFSAENEYKEVTGSMGKLKFDFGPTQEEEAYQIYQVLKYIIEISSAVHIAMRMQYINLSKYQDIVKEFNDRILLVLINNVEEYLTKVGIDMGLDENVTWNVSGGQVNIANDNSTINATQNNGISTDELDIIVNAIKNNLNGLSAENKETLIDSIEMIHDEIVKSEPKGKIISNGIKLIAPIMTIANGLPVLAGNIQKFIDFVTPYIH